MVMESSGRPVPPWGAGLVDALSRDRPVVLTRRDLKRYLDETGSSRVVDQVATDLQQLGWLTSLHLKGVWGFVPAGESVRSDPYLDLQGWRARDPDAVFFLAGEAAAWHLGYLPRRFSGPVAVWTSPGDRVPHGLRPYVSQVRVRWSPEDAPRLGPTVELLHRKGLDVTGWAGGLPALGPDALLVQLAVRPTSMRAWGDLVANLDVVAGDCSVDQLSFLLRDQSASAWQRAGYVLHRGGRTDDGLRLLDESPHERMTTAQLGHSDKAVWSNEFQVNDRIIARVQDLLGKA